jgi:hypothetical protein
MMGNISGDLYSSVQNNSLEGAKVTIKRILWDDSYAADKEIIIFKGFADIEFNRQVLVLSCRPVADLMNIKIPRHLFQEPCNFGLFETGCSLVQGNFVYAGIASGGSETTVEDVTRGIVYKAAFTGGDESNPIEIGDTVTGQTGAGTGVIIQIVYLTAATGFVWYVEQAGAQYIDTEEIQNPGADAVDISGAPAEDTTFYELGEITMTSGDCSGCRRPILSNATNTITVLWPFPAAIAATDTYNIYPGCDKRATTCQNRFNNASNFRGFLYIPKIEETIM